MNERHRQPVDDRLRQAQHRRIPIQPDDPSAGSNPPRNRRGMATAADRPVHDDRTLPGGQPGHDLVDKNRLMERSHNRRLLWFCKPCFGGDRRTTGIGRTLIEPPQLSTPEPDLGARQGWPPDRRARFPLVVRIDISHDGLEPIASFLIPVLDRSKDNTVK